MSVITAVPGTAPGEHVMLVAMRLAAITGERLLAPVTGTARWPQPQGALAGQALAGMGPGPHHGDLRRDPDLGSWPGAPCLR